MEARIKRRRSHEWQDFEAEQLREAAEAEALAAALGASERRQSLESERVAREEAKSLIAKAKALASAEESALKAAKHMAMQRG